MGCSLADDKDIIVQHVIDTLRSVVRLVGRITENLKKKSQQHIVMQILGLESLLQHIISRPLLSFSEPKNTGVLV
jgi:hypothetical protein